MTDLNLMHDWTLIDIQALWSDGTAVINLRSSSGEHVIVVSGLTKLNMTSEYPWGKSVSINCFGECDISEEKSHKLSIEMQSGDIILIEAESIKLPNLGK